MCWQWGIKTIIKTIRCRFYLFELHDSLPLYPWLKILVKFGEMAPSSWCRELFDSNLKAASNFDTIAFNLGSSREKRSPDSSNHSALTIDKLSFRFKEVSLPTSWSRDDKNFLTETSTNGKSQKNITMIRLQNLRIFCQLIYFIPDFLSFV